MIGAFIGTVVLIVGAIYVAMTFFNSLEKSENQSPWELLFKAILDAIIAFISFDNGIPRDKDD